MFLLKSIGSESANKIPVSSAKTIGAEVLLIILGKTFTYKRSHLHIKGKVKVPEQNLVGLHFLL